MPGSAAVFAPGGGGAKTQQKTLQKPEENEKKLGKPSEKKWEKKT